ncbi:oligosaccharide flippase family protein [Chryseobacterium koreense]|uniref:oligosaccharide flippase family protein n=1 Tax=Chryseobacterium koreense TaxID=232216 RepID=UPI0026ECCBC5|nr:oligosaccharide flippase family protein [Chryseobacterium koreense]
MIKKIRNNSIYFNNRKIIENFSFLSLIQVVSLVSPLITYPYLIKVLGLELYGTVIFAQAVVSYLSLVVNFGYHTTGPKEVSILRNHIRELSAFVSSVFIVKTVLWLITFVLFMLVISFFDYFRPYFLLYFFTFFVTVGDVLFPIWFFQGIEKMKYISYINIFVKLIFVVCIYIFIKEKSDYLLIPIINAAGAIISAIISIYIVFRKEGVLFIKVKYGDIKKSFRESSVLFVSSLSTSIYLSLNKLIVGSFLGMKDVAVYDLAEKVVSIIKTPIIILSQAVFPKISREKSIRFINKAMVFSLAGVFILYLLLFLFSDHIVYFFLHSHNSLAVNVIRIYGVSMFFLTIGIFLGGLRLIPFGYNKQYMLVMMANGIFYSLIISVLYFFKYTTLYSITMAYVLAEVFCVLYLLKINRKLHLI